MSPEILRETLVHKTSLYNLHKNDTYERCQVHSIYHVTESLSLLHPKIWNLIPVELKQSERLYSFIIKIKNWIPFGCPFRLCET